VTDPRPSGLTLFPFSPGSVLGRFVASKAQTQNHTVAGLYPKSIVLLVVAVSRSVWVPDLALSVQPTHPNLLRGTCGAMDKWWSDTVLAIASLHWGPRRPPPPASQRVSSYAPATCDLMSVRQSWPRVHLYIHDQL